MALLYPWATKEYLLWEMTIGQIVMYHNLGMEIKYPKQEGDGSLRERSYGELIEAREEARMQLQLGANSEEEREALKAKYGDI